MKSIFIGTSNLHKIEEIREIFNKNNIDLEILCPKDFNDVSEPVEDGFSFKENAIIKAKYYYEKYHIPCIAEDSGITISYLNNLPGIHSKRLLNHLCDYDKNEYILKIMNHIKNRKAKFYDVVCYIDSNGKFHTFEGINEGEIALKQEGNEGFGYDPIFLIPELHKTEAELGDEYKNNYSHRAIAFKKFIEYLNNYEN